MFTLSEMLSVLFCLYSCLRFAEFVMRDFQNNFTNDPTHSAKPLSTLILNTNCGAPHALDTQTGNTYMTHGIREVFLWWSYPLVTHTGVKYYMITSKAKRNNIFKTFSRHMSEDVMKNGMKNLWNHFKDRTRFHDFKSFSRGWKLMWLLYISTNSSHIFLIIPCSILHKHQFLHRFAGCCGTFPAWLTWKLISRNMWRFVVMLKRVVVFLVGCKHNIFDLGLRSGGSCGWWASWVQVDLDEKQKQARIERLWIMSGVMGNEQQEYLFALIFFTY